MEASGSLGVVALQVILVGSCTGPTNQLAVVLVHGVVRCVQEIPCEMNRYHLFRGGCGRRRGRDKENAGEAEELLEGLSGVAIERWGGGGGERKTDSAEEMHFDGEVLA